MEDILKKLKDNSIKALDISEDVINNIILDISKSIIINDSIILEANKLDLENNPNLSNVLKKRLELTKNQLLDISKYLEEFSIVKTIYNKTLEVLNPTNKNLDISKVAYPFGVVLAIYESRPNVTLDIASMCIKTHNICILKGGKECINTNKAMVKLINEVVSKYINYDLIYLVENNSRDITSYLLEQREYIDLVIPRGSKSLIDYVVNNAKMNYIETGAGNCHLYIDYNARMDYAIDIAVNAKVQKPSVCNSIETILVSKDIASTFLPLLKMKFDTLGVEIRGCKDTLAIIDCNSATEEDYYQEYNDYIVSIKIVDDVKAAIAHINKYGTHHSEAIISEDLKNVETFFKLTDSACLYHNASTRFSDGGCFGFGLELGISTSKMHARGPMGIDALFTTKYLISGNGDIRK